MVTSLHLKKSNELRNEITLSAIFQSYKLLVAISQCTSLFALNENLKKIK